MPAVNQSAIDGTFVEPGDRYRCFVFDAIIGTVAAVSEVGADVGIGAGLAGAAAEGAADVGLAGALGAGAAGAADAGLIALPAITVEGGLPAALGAGAAGLGGAEAAGLGGLATLGAAEGFGGGGELAGALGAAEGFGGGGELATLGGDAAGGVGAAGSGVSDLFGGNFNVAQAVEPSVGSVFNSSADAAAGATPGGGITTGATAPGALTASPATSIGGPVASAPVAPASAGPLSPTATGVGLGSDAGNAGIGAGSSLTGAPGATDVPVESFGGGGDVASTSTTSGLDKAITSATGGLLNQKDLGNILSLGGLGYNILSRNKPIPGQQQVSNAANNLNATATGQALEGAQLESYLSSGTLPPGLAAGVRSATQAAMANIKSGYASRGMSGSSAEAQDLQAANDRALAASQQVALNLLQQGSSMVGQAVNAEGASAAIFQSIMNDSLQRDSQLGSSIGNFAAALAGGGTTAKAA